MISSHPMHSAAGLVYEGMSYNGCVIDLIWSFQSFSKVRWGRMRRHGAAMGTRSRNIDKGYKGCEELQTGRLPPFLLGAPRTMRKLDSSATLLVGGPKQRQLTFLFVHHFFGKSGSLSSVFANRGLMPCTSTAGEVSAEDFVIGGPWLIEATAHTHVVHTTD
eukprot:TRINITY_DN1212_c0_g2_i1.p1 TRINITY_DN1212_c0_g2~~TRINITY_DN1212_c0_g2_i1.p1  ORF type:complete len:162 (+),score=8.61 TRINITY_DN1212_c0_g2_i1:94-579(+)